MVAILLVNPHKSIFNKAWGPLGASTIIQDILTQIEPDTIIARLDSFQ